VGLAFLLIFVLLAAGIVTAGWFYNRKFAQRYRGEAERQLSAIADLKVGELTQWRKERLGDADVLFKNASFSALVRDVQNKPADADAQRQLQTWLEKYGTHFRYDHVRLLDTQGVTRLSWPKGLPATASSVARHAAEASRLGQVMIQDFYRSEDDQTVRLALLIPILDEQDANRPLGVLVLRIDPNQYLYPFIQRWTTPSPSAETLLLRRDGNEVHYLNDLRHQPNAAFALRIPLTRTAVPAVKAVLGETGFLEGPDYRGVSVVSIARAVPDSPWFLIAKIDAAEIEAPLRAHLWQAVVMIGVLLFAAGAGVGLVWRQQRVRSYREQAEVVEALRQSEFKYRILVENANEIVYSLTPDGVFTYVSPAWTKILGHDISEVENRPFQPFVHPEDVPVCLAFLELTIKTGVAQAGVEYRVLHKDGNWRWHTTNASPLLDDSGKVVAYIAIGHDITERKRAEAILRNLERSIEQSIGGIARADMRDGSIVFANKAWARMHGYEVGEVLGKHLRIFHTQQQMEHEVNPFNEKVVKHGAYAAEIGHVRKDGTVFLTWMETTVIEDEQHHPLEFIASAIDITERKQAEDALRSSEASLRKAQAIAHLGSWELDLVTNRLIWSDEVYRIFGLEPQQLLPTYETFLDFVHPEDRTVVNDAYTGSVRDGKGGYEIEHRIVRRSTGEIRYVYEWCSHTSDVTGRILRSLGTVLDVTERKQAEEELQRSEHMLVESQRMAGLGSWELDIPAGVFRLSKVMSELTGIEGLHDISMEEWAAMLHPEDRAMILDYLQNEVIARGQPVDIEFRAVRANDKTTRWLHSLGKPGFDTDGRVVKLYGSAQDIQTSGSYARGLAS
jgi:PAS domain S-box-containing protein